MFAWICWVCRLRATVPTVMRLCVHVIVHDDGGNEPLLLSRNTHAYDAQHISMFEYNNIMLNRQKHFPLS